MPQDTKYCTEISNCIDNDGDGYGVGVDCLGPDYDDSDSGVYEYPDLILEEEAPDDERLDEDPNFLILILGVVSCVLIIVLFFGRKKRIKRKGPVKNVVDLKKKEKAKKSEKILLDYMKVYGEDFTLKELRRELVGDGFTEKQINNAAKKLGIK